MRKSGILLTNKRIVRILSFVIVMITIFLIIHQLFLLIIPESELLRTLTNYIFISSLVIIYLFTTSIYYYRIKIDAYAVYIISFNTISNLMQNRNYMDISHDMLIGYTVINQPFSFNKTIILKIKREKKKSIAKRFNISLIRNNDLEIISNKLDRIIAQNN
ncbi:hypothetical protein OAK24_01560 [Flavobacteriales bacterium]|nr:hypothetical protein [Flavobacteriales bacterium]